MYMYVYVYTDIYGYTAISLKTFFFFIEKQKPIIIENISATPFINSLSLTSHFSLMIHFKTNLQVIIYIIYIIIYK